MKRLDPRVIIFTTVVVDLIGFGIVIPVLPLYSERLGATPTMIGFLVAIYSVMQFIFSPILGRLSDRIGRRPVLAVSVLGSAVAFLVTGLASALWVLFIARAIDGITGGNISTAQAYIADITKPEDRAKGVGLIGAGFGIGFILGPILGGLASHFGASVPFFLAAGLALVNGLAIFFFLPETRHVHHAEFEEDETLPGMVETLRMHKLWTPVSLYVVATLAMTLVYTCFALVVARRFNLDASGAGYLFGTMGLAGIILQFRIGSIVKRFGEVQLARASLFLYAASLLGMVFAPSLLWFVLSLIPFGVANGLNNTILLTLVSKQAPGNIQGRIIGLTQGTAALSRAVGPILAGLLFDHLGVAAPFLAAAVVALFAGLAALRYLRAPQLAHT